jgi:heterodisulfide reductase subunit A-like polyferredoxin
MIKGLSKAVSQTANIKAAKSVLESPKRGFKFTVEGRVADAAPAAAASSREYPVVDHDYDACVVGAGGAGLRAAFGLVQEGFKTAVITKVSSLCKNILPYHYLLFVIRYRTIMCVYFIFALQLTTFWFLAVPYTIPYSCGTRRN